MARVAVKPDRPKVDWPATLDSYGRLAGLPPAKPEYRFAAMATGGIGKGVRNRLLLAGLKDWRFDLAYPDHLVAVEVDGGAFIQGRHARGAGMRDDCAKISTAAALGWRVLRVLPEQIARGQAFGWLEAALGRRPLITGIRGLREQLGGQVAAG